MDLFSLLVLFSLYKIYRRRIVLWSGLAILILGWILFCGVIYATQDKIGLPQPKLTEGLQFYIKSAFSNIEDISIETPDNIKLKGYLIHNSTANKSPLMIYFGGNNEQVPPFFLKSYKGWNVAFINYRGYGLSEGTPTEKNLRYDALTIYDTLFKREDVDKGNIVMAGRSLGTGVAIYVAKERSVQGVILISPYDYIKGVQEDQFPFIPPALIKNSYNPIELVKSIKVPVLCFIGNQDRLIFPKRSLSLIKEWAGESKIRTIEEANHENIYFSHYIYDDTVLFLHKIHPVE
jgi:alpha/beta superfamily hydrolase